MVCTPNSTHTSNAEPSVVGGNPSVNLFTVALHYATVGTISHTKIHTKNERGLRIDSQVPVKSGGGTRIRTGG